MKTYIKKSLLVISAALLMGSAFAQTCNINQQGVTYTGPTSGCGAINGVVNTSSSQTGVLYTLLGNGNSHIGTSKMGTGGALYFPTGNINQNTTFKVYSQIDTTIKSLLFSGTGFSHVNIGTALNSVFANTNLITVEAWVYPTNGYGLRTVVSNYEGSNMQYLLRIQNLQPSFYVGTGTGGMNFVYALSPNTIPLNTWTHIAGTWDGAALKIYVNGIQEATTSVTGNFGSVSNNLKIGGGLNNGTEDFSGNITDVRIWNNTRTQSEINTNKDICLDVASPGLLAYYKMSDALGSSTLTDSTGHGYNGTLTNMNSNTAWQQNTPLFLCGCTLLMTQQPSVTVTIPAITGDLNCNGSISNGEVSGDSNYNGVIDNGEIAGDINGNGSIDFGEIFGDTNGNGIIDLGETNTILVSGFDSTNVHLNGAYNFDGIVNGKPSYFKLPMAGGDCSSLGNEYACNFDLQTWIKWDGTKWRFYGNTQCQWEAAFGECVPAAVGVSGIQAYIDSLANINNTTNSYYAPCNGWNYSGFFGTPIISGDCGCGLVMQTVTGSATICYGADLPITVNSTETGVVYYLRKNPYHTIVAGPIAGTGNAITFNTGFNSNTITTYNVYAHSAGDSANCHVRMNDLVTIVVNQPTVVGDANCNGFIDNSEISGDTNYNGVIDGSEVAGDTNGNGTIGAGETAGDTNGNGTIGVGETAGDTNGNGTIGVGEVAGDTNGNGTIGAGETAGDTNGNGTIGAGEITGDTNGNGTIGAGETAGDTNGDGTIGAGEITGDTNGNGTIDSGETCGDTNGDGTISGGELTGDIDGDGTIGSGETFGDSNGNGTIDSGETVGIAKKNLTDDIKVYPNPSSGIFVVEGFSKGEKFNVVNALGEIVMSITTTNAKTKIDLSNKANGVYFIKTNNGYTHKLVKQD